MRYLEMCYVSKKIAIKTTTGEDCCLSTELVGLYVYMFVSIMNVNVRMYVCVCVYEGQ